MPFLPEINLGPKRYAPVGQCIYCGKTEYSSDGTRPLGDEHIVPYGLNGRWVLPQASCQQCEKITGRFEQNALREALHSPRFHLKLSSRHRTKPSTLPIFKIKDNRLVKEQFPASDYPAQVILVFPGSMPGIMIEKKKGYVPEVAVEVVPLNKDAPSSKLTSLHAIGFDLHSFLRMIAKIAHSFATAEWGLHSFTPTLLDIIIREDTDFFYYIGQAKSGLIPKVSDMLLALRTFKIQHYKKEFAVVELAMFRQYDGPLYYIVAGEFAAS